MLGVIEDTLRAEEYFKLSSLILSMEGNEGFLVLG